MIVVIGRFRLPTAQVAAAKPLMERVIGASLAEPGCRSYSYAEDISEPGLFRVSEEWDGRAALEAHFRTEHMKQWQHEREQLGFHDRDVTAYEAGKALPS